MGSTLSHNTRIDSEVAQRISKASQAFGRLQASVWNRHGIHLNTKLKRIKDERLPKRLFYGDVDPVARRQGGQKRHYKDTLKKSLKLLKIIPASVEDLAQERPAMRKSVKTGSEIHEANRIAAARARKSGTKVTSTQDQHRRCPGPANMPALSTHLLLANRSDYPTLTPGINSNTPTIIETTSQYSSPVTNTAATTTTFTSTTTISDVE
ncbi:unnamed protein product [Schistocephalus solidus]|uniref:Uncharacterized protein n=1 Tax=Schistocephalus solidus TaxID=70667 RepID=A0A183STX8_SCHSO|nr:unnamed protein product [Schistocephalus solidus]